MNRIAHISLLALVVLAVAMLGPLQVAQAQPQPTRAATNAQRDTVKRDTPTAAERRAASSEFEREKLDPKAFADPEASAAAKRDGGGSSGGTGSLIRAIVGFIVVIGSVFGVHWLLRRWGASRLQGSVGRTGVIDVVATTSLAQGRALHLVRVGEELVLVGATEQSITRIGDFDASVIGSSAGNAGNSEFQSMLAGAMYGQQPGVSAREPFIKRVLDNLRMTTAR